MDEVLQPLFSEFEDVDETIRKSFNRFKRNRPHLDIQHLSDMLPFGAREFPEFPPYYKVEPSWDLGLELPSELEALRGTIVQRYSGPTEAPQYNRYFDRVGTEHVSCPSGSIPIFTPINVRLPYKCELPDGFRYICRVVPDEENPSSDGYAFYIPEGFLQQYNLYTLVLSRSKLKCCEYWTVTLSTNSTIYLSIVRSTGKLTRYQGTSVTPIASYFHNDFGETVSQLVDYWVSSEWIPDPSWFTLSTGEVLSFAHERVEDE